MCRQVYARASVCVWREGWLKWQEFRRCDPLQIRHFDAIIKLSQKLCAAIMTLAALPLFYGFCSIVGSLGRKADGHVAHI